MIDGIPSHDLLSKAFRDAEWLNSRTDSDDSQPFYSYFVIGLGQFGANSPHQGGPRVDVERRLVSRSE